MAHVPEAGLWAVTRVISPPWFREPTINFQKILRELVLPPASSTGKSLTCCGALLAVGTEAVQSSVMGKQHCRRIERT